MGSRDVPAEKIHAADGTNDAPQHGAPAVPLKSRDELVAGFPGSVGTSENADDAARRLKALEPTEAELGKIAVTHPKVVEAYRDRIEQERALAEGEPEAAKRESGPCKCPGEPQPGAWHRRSCHNWRAA